MDDERLEAVSPSDALALLTNGILSRSEPDPADDPHGAAIYWEALTLLLDPDADVASSGNVYASIAAMLHRLNSDHREDGGSSLRQALAALSAQPILANSPSIVAIGASLIITAHHYGVIRDDALLWDVMHLLLRTDVPLWRLEGFCSRSALGATPKGRGRWLRLHYKLLLAHRYLNPDHQQPIAERMSIISDFADGMPNSVSSPAIGWVVSAASETLSDLEEHAAQGHDAPDTWLGSLLRVCDSLVSLGQFGAVEQLLKRSAEVVALCGEGGPTALAPNEPSPFREDLPFLRNLIESRATGEV
ncbi:hypothetical protein DRA43_13095 [Micromonospora provocatoris]|nr:hypothetical protein [Micromonospora provocatoris]RBJ04884.1 hypothetical protein DRA43_13095 [Micromonospora provocatoris]